MAYFTRGGTGILPGGSPLSPLDGVIFIILWRRIVTVDNYTPVKIGNYEPGCAIGGERVLFATC